MSKCSHIKCTTPTFWCPILVYQYTCPVNLHCIPRFMLNAHCCLCCPCPFAILIAELSVHVWRLIHAVALCTVFIPQQAQVNTLAHQFPVYVSIVRLDIWAFLVLLLRIEYCSQFFIRNRLVNWPRNPHAVCHIGYISYSVT